MESLGTIVRHELLHHVPQVPFSEEDEMIQALVPDRLDEPFRMRAAVGTMRRSLYAFHPSLSQDGLEHLGEQRVAIVDQVLRMSKILVYPQPGLARAISMTISSNSC